MQIIATPSKDMAKYCQKMCFFSFSAIILIVTDEITKPITKPKLGIKTYPNPPPPENMGSPINISAIKELIKKWAKALNRQLPKDDI